MPPTDYTPAVRRDTTVLFGLAGPSSSGKTWSAMALASGLSGGEPFLMIDTEARRGLHYAEDFDFEHVDMSPPFSPKAFEAQVADAERRGFRAVVIDSWSHEWEGEGGVLDMADKQADKGPGKFRDPKQKHKQVVRRLMQARCHLVFCMRAHDKLDLSGRDAKGRMVVKRLGWTPIAERQFIYDMTVSLTLPQGAAGYIDLSLPHKIPGALQPLFPDGERITADMGQMLGGWATGGEIINPNAELWRQAREAANDGRGYLRAWFTALDKAQRRALKPLTAELNELADQADRITGALGGEAEQGEEANE